MNAEPRSYPDDPRWPGLIAPVRPDAPCGSDIRGSAAYSEIKEAQREDDPGDMGVWQRTRKTADWPLVSKLCTAELTRNSKDLQIAVWWLLAEVKLRGFSGFTQGLRLIEELIDRYWDGLYPPVEDGDTILRTVPLEWMGSRMVSHLRQVPLTKGGHGWFRFQESVSIPAEEEAQRDDKKRRQREEAVNDGKLTPEEFLEGLRATPGSFWEEAQAALEEAAACLGRLDARCNELCPDEPPTFGKLIETVRELSHTIRGLPARKGGNRDAPAGPAAAAPAAARRTENKDDPFATFQEEEEESGPAPSGGSDAFDPFAPFGGDAEEAVSDEDEAAAEEEDFAGRAPRRETGWRPASNVEAPAGGFDAVFADRAASLREDDPASLASYLLVRGVRWGELRGGGAELDPRLMEAPPVSTRRRLRELRREGAWRDLLEESETAASQPWGRAWLDPTAYTMLACRELGGEFDAIHDALSRELLQLLEWFPALPEALLEDETPCANAETRELLRELMPDAEPVRPPRPLESLYAPDSAADLADLGKRLRRQPHGRGRFQYRVRIAAKMIEEGRDATALAVLRDLLQEIDERRLAEWEKPEDIALPVRLYCEVSRRSGEEPSELTVQLLARLDPLAAAELG